MAEQVLFRSAVRERILLGAGTLSRAYQLLEPGSVVLLTTPRRRRESVMAMPGT
ncbi:hypothetical protein [Neoroseomonas lacus]|uniref:Uncharacterized protein n=1 Tax=Neoroseomonas lacus TaxID=287609 RepID=A0A917NM28_9PROT|nr:hypothetical protein [Neoroseomonas lacus]GGJ10974.1 hypothetical protein GCM10011320_17570 [Neoroseomonas lacus]